MSLNIRAMAGYLMSRGLDKNTALLLAKDRAENRFDSSLNFDNLVFNNKGLMGKKDAMLHASTVCLQVKGYSEYPLNRVQALVACLAKHEDSLENILECRHFDSEPMKNLLSEEGSYEILVSQFYKSKNIRDGFLGLF